MTREEILEKSRRENESMDEREQAVMLRSSSIAKAVGLALCMLVVLVSDILGADPSASLSSFAIYWGMQGTDRVYRWWKLRNRADLFWSIGSFGFTLAFIVAYLHVVLNGA